jgi:hypothetical protein
MMADRDPRRVDTRFPSDILTIERHQKNPVTLKDVARENLFVSKTGRPPGHFKLGLAFL